MSFRLRLAPEVADAFRSWALPDAVMVEARLRLQRLQDDPADLLLRAQLPFNGMVLYFDIIDPTNRLRQYHFIFHCLYGQDEETLVVADGRCLPDFV